MFEIVDRRVKIVDVPDRTSAHVKWVGHPPVSDQFIELRRRNSDMARGLRPAQPTRNRNVRFRNFICSSTDHTRETDHRINLRTLVAFADAVAFGRAFLPQIHKQASAASWFLIHRIRLRRLRDFDKVEREIVTLARENLVHHPLKVLPSA